MSTTTSPTTPQTYHGNCHCAAVTFSVSVPPVESVYACTCSLCSKISARWVMFKPEDLKIERGEDKLAEYKFGTKTNSYKFCSTCGIHLAFMSSSINFINARTFRDFDLEVLKLVPYDGASRPPAFEHPPYKGETIVPGDGEKVYTGGCHCGNLTVAFKVDPTSPIRTSDCNCSICARNGCKNAFLPKSNVGFHVDQSSQMSIYRFGTKMAHWTFCGICGVEVINRIGGEDFKSSGVPEAMASLAFVNLNVVENIDWKDFNVEKMNGKSRGSEYVVDV